MTLLIQLCLIPASPYINIRLKLLAFILSTLLISILFLTARFYSHVITITSTIIGWSHHMLLLLLSEWIAWPSSSTYEYMLFNIELPLPPTSHLILPASLDSLSMLLLLLTALLLPSIQLHSLLHIRSYGHYRASYQLSAWIHLAILILTLCFLTHDLLLFFILFEASLIPMYILLIQFGSRIRKIRAALQLVIYTMLGSASYLFALLILILSTGSTASSILISFEFAPAVERTLWLFLMIAMLVKLPVMPVHSWLPQAHAESPTLGSVLLAALVLKLSALGLFRFIMPLFPSAVSFFTPALHSLAVISLVYGSLLTLRQVDVKKLIAYSSVAHMALVLAGFSCSSGPALSGVLVLLFTHGLVSAALFFLVGMLYDRVHSRLLRYLGGTLEGMPLWSCCFLVASCGNLSLPGTGSFVAELLILSGCWYYSVTLACLLSWTLVLSGAYSLWLFNRVAHGMWLAGIVPYVLDMIWKELVVVCPLLILSIVVGLWPWVLMTGISGYCALLGCMVDWVMLMEWVGGGSGILIFLMHLQLKIFCYSWFIQPWLSPVMPSPRALEWFTVLFKLLNPTE